MSAWSAVRPARAIDSPIANGMTRASVVISAATSEAGATGRIASWSSTSPLKAAMTHGRPASQVSAL